MSTELVALAVLMAAVTYPARAVPLLAPGVERLPAPVLEYLRLIGPATLTALAVTSVLVVVDPDGARTLRAGVEVLAVAVCVAVVAWRRNLLLGLIAAVALVAVARAAGVA
jgi:branched-subunit amino acid transport protein